MAEERLGEVEVQADVAVPERRAGQRGESASERSKVQADVAVPERRAGQRGEHLAQRRRDGALLVQVVDPVEEEHGVADAAAAQRLDDPSRRSRAGTVHIRRAAELPTVDPRVGAPEGRGHQ